MLLKRCHTTEATLKEIMASLKDHMLFSRLSRSVGDSSVLPCALDVDEFEQMLDCVDESDNDNGLEVVDLRTFFVGTPLNTIAMERLSGLPKHEVWLSLG